MISMWIKEVGIVAQCARAYFRFFRLLLVLEILLTLSFPQSYTRSNTLLFESNHRVTLAPAFFLKPGKKVNELCIPACASKCSYLVDIIVRDPKWW